MLTKYYEPAEKVGNHRESLFSLKSLVERLDPTNDLEKIPCHEENFEARDCQTCSIQDKCCDWERLKTVFTEPYMVCFCNQAEHRANCQLGEAGKKLRRQIEDRLRKDPLLMLWVSRIIGLSE